MPEIFKPEKITTIGKLRLFRTPSGAKVVVLPTCTLPLHHLVEENWAQQDKVIPSTREIKKVTTLKNGRTMETSIYIKPIAFKPDTLRRIRLSNREVFKEARKLIHLQADGERVETPQAIILQKNKPYALLTTEIKGTSVSDEESPFNEINSEIARLKQKGIRAVDVRDENLIRTPDGKLNHIDVESWNIPEIERKNRRKNKPQK